MPIKTNLKSLDPSRERFKRSVPLLSRGYSAPDLFPGGSVTVYPWDTEVSAWLAANRGLQAGRILYTLAGRLTGFTDKQVEKIVSGEVILILLVARAAVTNQTIQYTARCPFCGTTERCTVTVPDDMEKLGEKAEGYPGWDEITLPATKDVLRIRPLLVGDEIAVSERLPEKGLDLSETGARLLTGLLSVNGGVPESIEERVTYYRALPPEDLQFYVDQADKLTPHLNTQLKHACPNPACKRVFTHELALDEEFFRPSRLG